MIARSMFNIKRTIMTACWVISFFVMIVLLMLNMLLAIIFEKYSAVQGEVGSGAKTLWFQMYEMVRRQVQTMKKKRVNLGFIVASVRKDFAAANPTGFGKLLVKEQVEQLKEDHTFLTFDDLCTKVPGMPKSQVERLGRKAWGVFDGLSPAELDAQDVVADPRREMFTEAIRKEAGLSSSEKKLSLADQKRNSKEAADLEASGADLAAAAAPKRDAEMDERIEKRLAAVEGQVASLVDAV